MGEFLKGSWRAESDFPHDRTGHFVRPDAPFRNWVTASGEAGPSGAGGFKAEAGRYHLIISLACPWAHRTLIFRKLKGLESMISLSVVHWLLAERGWTFDKGRGVIPDPIFGASELREFYVKARSDYSGRVTVPVLWDKKTGTIVNNESSEIIRMFNHAFDAAGAAEGRLLSERAENRDRRAQRPHLRDCQQRRLSRRLRHHASRLMRRRSGRCSRRWTCSRRGSSASGFCVGKG